MAQQTIFQVATAVIRIDNLSVVVTGQRVDRQIAALKIGFQRNVRRGITGESGIA